MASYQQHEYNAPAVAPYWELSISRLEQGADGRLGRQFTATISHVDGLEIESVQDGKLDKADRPTVQVCRGSAVSWAEAINVVSTCGDTHLACAATGAMIYGEGAQRAWGVVRVFLVQYPWRDPREPNAAHTPFHLVGPYGFDADSDGAVVSCYELKHAAARKFAERAGANAFLLGPYKAAPRYRLYHREGMTKFDEIDIDEWRARIIAGTRD